MRATYYAKGILKAKSIQEKSSLLTAFLRNGHNINEPIGWFRRETLMHKAARSNDVQLGRLLRENGAAIDKQNRFGKTPRNLAYSPVVMLDFMDFLDEVEATASL
ncbi:MAG: ankyrin repeat domain-containing protein [Candidatus Micrarchaeaceae archaeon]|jgi:hypothetical protein